MRAVQLQHVRPRSLDDCRDRQERGQLAEHDDGKEDYRAPVAVTRR